MHKKKYKSPPFVMLYKELLKDKDYKKLSSSAKVIYTYMRNNFNPGKYEDPLTFELPYESMKGIMTDKTTSRAIKELVKAGFISVPYKGGLCGVRKCKSLYKYEGKWAFFTYKGKKIC